MGAPKYGDPVHIIWIDSFVHDTASYWAELDELDYTDSAPMRSVGFYVKQTSDWLTIAQCLDTNDVLGGVFSIPSSCVQEIRVIKT